MKSSPSTGLTKSRFLSGRQCLKRLALEVFHPEQAEEPNAGRAALYLAGARVGVLARLRHPGGVLIASDDRNEALAQTREALANPEVPAIFEGAFLAGDLYVRADILVREDQGWSLQEVKSSTRVKELHQWDLAVQALAIEESGLPLVQAGILHLNADYLRSDTLDLEALFLLEDRLPQVRGLFETVRADLLEQSSILARAEVPMVYTGTHCDEPWPCPFYKTCHPPRESTHPGFLPRSRQLVRKLARHDIHDLRDIPRDFRLGRLQKRAKNCILKGRDFVSPELQEVLESVDRPLYFMDFEAFSPAVPRYFNTYCYQAIPTQWSLHFLKDGVLEHQEFLYEGEGDPRREFATTLLAALGDQGSILVYSSYEKTQLLKLVEAWPDLYDGIHAVIERLQDLYVVIKDHYYHPDFLGSYSIKKVLPALVPELTYEDLEIRDGGSAAARFEDLLDPETSAEEAAGIREALLRYCERDTLAMVEIRRALIERCGPAQPVRP